MFVFLGYGHLVKARGQVYLGEVTLAFEAGEDTLHVTKPPPVYN